jgi:endo-1,4-beta-D-glucanase Y
MLPLVYNDLMFMGRERAIQLISRLRSHGAVAQILGLLISGGLTLADATAAPRHPFPQHVELTPGSLQPNHRSQAQQDADVRNLYDSWKSRYLVQAGTESDGHPRYRIRTSRNAGDNTVSEGQGYGMVIVALMAGHDPSAQTIFDGLWEFSGDHRSTIDARLMDWKVEADEVADPSGNDSAFDGDCDIAFALLLAEQQWGTHGRFDYRAEALSVISGIMASTIGPVSRLPLLGDWVDPNGASYSQYTPRTSDFMLDNFRAFGEATGDAVWASVIAASQAAVAQVQADFSPTTGLMPDFLEPVSATDRSFRPASPGFLEGSYDGSYYYNAVRVPFRLGLDALLNGDAVSRAQIQKISLWASLTTGGDPANIKAGRELDGDLLLGNDFVTTIFAAPLGVAAMNEPTQQQWLNDVYDAVRVSDEGYYEDTISLLCLLVMTGNYWNPSLVSVPSIPSMSMWSLIAFAALLLGTSCFMLRGRLCWP